MNLCKQTTIIQNKHQSYMIVSEGQVFYKSDKKDSWSSLHF